MQLCETKVLLMKVKWESRVVTRSASSKWLERRVLCQLPVSRCPGLVWPFDGAAGCGRGGKSNVKMR